MMKFYITQGVVISVYTTAFLFWLILLQNRNLITPGDFALVFILNFKMFDKLYELSHQLREFVVNWGTVEQALTILDTAPEIQDDPAAQPITIKQGEVVFKNVQFHYKGSEPLFQNKSITIKSGQKVGLVGYSGGGKSTFVNLIFYTFLFVLNRGGFCFAVSNLFGGFYSWIKGGLIVKGGVPII